MNTLVNGLVELKLKALLTTLVGGIILLSAYIYVVLVLKPKRLRSKLERQGFRGPPPSSLLLGNILEIQQIKSQLTSHPVSTDGPLSHDWTPLILPHLKLWQQQYGPTFIYSTGNMPTLCTTDPTFIKEITLCPSVDLGKPSFVTKDLSPLLGEGVISATGSVWTHQRKIIAPEFYPDKVKGMMRIMVEATASMLNLWEERINKSGGTTEFIVDQDLTNLSADIISKTAFGSSYSQGKQIFSKIRTLQELMAKTQFFGIPGSRYLPTKTNWQIRRLEKEIHSMILRVVKERMVVKHNNDFLQKILEGVRNYTYEDDITLKKEHEKPIVDNCKTIYFAGHETTAIAAAWSLMLLAAYPGWQARARAEVVEVCQDGILAADDLKNMKVLTMIIQETLRLYPLGVHVPRSTLQDANLNGIQIPKEFDIQVPIALLHHDPDLWGPDVHEFNPERFANGIARACKVPQAFMPFGFGSRVCLGQNFAMVELKVIISLILSKFIFSLSPAYQHSPSYKLFLQPGHGVKLNLRRA